MTNPIINFSLDQDANDTTVLIPRKCLHHYTEEFNKEEVLRHVVKLEDGLWIVPVILFINNRPFTCLERCSLLVEDMETGAERLEEEYNMLTKRLREEGLCYLPYFCYATDFKLEGV